MSKKIELKSFSRDLKENNKQIRKDGYIPAVVYGLGMKNVNLKIKYSDFEKIPKHLRESGMVNLEVGGKNLLTLIKNVQIDPLKDKGMHIDFMQIDPDKPVEVEVALNFVGESPAVKEQGGMIVKNSHSILISCLPLDLVGRLKVDLENLKNISDKIQAGGLELPKGITLLSAPSDTIVSVVEPRIIEEEKPEETIEEEKKEGETEAEAKEGKGENKKDEKAPEADKKDKK